MNSIKKIILSATLSLLVLVLLIIGHALLLIGNFNLAFRAWLTSQEWLFQILYASFFDATFYSLAILAGINLIRIWFEKDPAARKSMRKWIKPVASLKLAVVIMILLAVLTAAGTIVESYYDLEAAQNLVYHTWFMYGTLALLCINLLAVIFDRLPWKEHHLSFILAHIGIILLLLGSLETAQKGVDGSMSLNIGQSNRYVTLPETDIAVFSSFNGDNYTQLYRRPFDIYDHNIDSEPLEFPMGSKRVKITEVVRYALASDSIIESERPESGPALRFQVNNDNVNVSEWLFSEAKGKLADFNFGPAKLSLVSELPERNIKANEIYLSPGSEKELRYRVFSRTKGRVQDGVVKEGGFFVLPWMGLTFRVLRYFPQAEKNWSIRRLDYPTPLSTAALKLNFDGKDYWLQKNDLLKFFTEDAVYIVAFQNRRVDVGFPIYLKKFEVGRYQGTMRAASYSSLVDVPAVGEMPAIGDYTIAMNEPLKHNGFTFYQASFQEDEAGNPTASVLSVNQDPGRWEKYLGSLLITLGVIMMFWFKKKKARKQPA